MITTASTERLALFVEVAHYGSMTTAADILGYSVSAVSQQVRKLEREAGIALIERHSRGITFTDAGRAVIEHAKQIQGRLTSLHSTLDDIAGARRGNLKLATFPTAGSSLAPLAISKFRSKHPDVTISVHSARLTTLIDLLLNREIYMSLLWDYPWSRLSEPELELKVLMDDRNVLVVPRSHPLADRAEVSMSDLLDMDWVVRAGDHPNIDVLIHAADRVGFQPTVAFRANDYQEAQAFVAAGIGIALVPRLALSVLRDDVCAIPLVGDAPSRRIYLARLAGSEQTPAEAQITRSFQEAALDLSLNS